MDVLYIPKACFQLALSIVSCVLNAVRQTESAAPFSMFIAVGFMAFPAKLSGSCLAELLVVVSSCCPGSIF